MFRHAISAVPLLCLPFWLSGCTQAWNDVYKSETEHQVSSSLLDYLYPDKQGLNTAQNQAKPLKETPQFWLSGSTDGPSAGGISSKQYSESPRANGRRVALAFVPTAGEIPGLSEARKVSLLRQVHKTLSEYSFVGSVEIVPQMHLRRGNGFQQLEQIAQIFHVDTVALVSYDQVMHTDDNELAFLYLTVVGAYVVPGSEFDTQTFVDTVLIDVKSKSFILRAVGVDGTQSATTLIGSTKSKRNKLYKSFERAFADMLGGLSANANAAARNEPASRI